MLKVNKHHIGLGSHGYPEVTESVNTDKTKCTACSACVQNCPISARNWIHERIIRGANWLATEHGNRKEPEVFL